jgi:hypothetical protein
MRKTLYKVFFFFNAYFMVFEYSYKVKQDRIEVVCKAREKEADSDTIKALEHLFLQIFVLFLWISLSIGKITHIY